jgi:hypothetical protein
MLCLESGQPVGIEDGVAGRQLHRSRRQYYARDLPPRTEAAVYRRLRAVTGMFPRSRHLPLAVTDGSLRENVNKTGVRFWTDALVRWAGTLSSLDARLP